MVVKRSDGPTMPTLATPLLSKLKEAVDALVAEHQDRSVEDGNENFVEVCKLIEEVFNHGTKIKTSFLGDELGYVHVRMRARVCVCVCVCCTPVPPCPCATAAI